MACFSTYSLLAEVCDPEQSAENRAFEGRCQVALHWLVLELLCKARGHEVNICFMSHFKNVVCHFFLFVCFMPPVSAFPGCRLSFFCCCWFVLGTRCKNCKLYLMAKRPQAGLMGLMTL